jgi:hypothetical protein
MMLTVPRINQYERYGADGSHYCTVATTEMYLWWANDEPPGVAIGPEVYKGVGSGANIAAAINNHSRLNLDVECQFTTGGTLADIRHTLADGYPVPMGVDCLEATIWGTGTVSRADLKAGDTHPRGAAKPYPDGHWVLVFGYDLGALYANDPDTGTTIKMTYRGDSPGLFNSAGKDGSIYLVLSVPL